MDGAGGKHRSAAVTELGFVEASVEAALAVGQLSGYS
jgi:hypothetical protein